MNIKLLKQAISLLDPQQKRKLVLLVLVQSFLGILDLIGVLLMGVVTSVVISGLQPTLNSSFSVQPLLTVLGIENLPFQQKVFILVITTTIFFVLKTLLSLLILKYTFNFLGRVASSVSISMLSKTLSQEGRAHVKDSEQSILFKVTSGVSAIFIYVLGCSAALISEYFLLALLFVGILYLDMNVAITSLIFFSLIGYFMHRLSSLKSQNLGRENTQLTIKNSDSLIHLFTSFREIFVRGQVGSSVKEISDNLESFNNNVAKLQFLPNVSKYIIEASVITGSVVISSIQFIFHDAIQAITLMAVFIAAGSRIAPAILRIQNLSIQIQSNTHSAISTLHFAEELGSVKEIQISNVQPSFCHNDFVPDIEIIDVSLRYSPNSDYVLKGINLKFEFGKYIAIVGESGAGKSSLVDVLLGVIKPTEGQVKIAGLSPFDAIQKWPGGIGYVPQSIQMINKGLASNILFGIHENFESNARVNEVEKLIGTIGLSERSQQDQNVGNFINQGWSGGQRQRIGIARALLTNPKILVLDEATSALDSMSELEISKILQEMRGTRTLIVVAHRLETVKNADLVVYLENGKVTSCGSFHEVRNSVANFDKAAIASGIDYPKDSISKE